VSKPRRCTEGGILAADGSCCPGGPHPPAEPDPDPWIEPGAVPRPSRRRDEDQDDDDPRAVRWDQR
jgi:hypothetical protein